MAAFQVIIEGRKLGSTVPMNNKLSMSKPMPMAATNLPSFDLIKGIFRHCEPRLERLIPRFTQRG